VQKESVHKMPKCLQRASKVVYIYIQLTVLPSWQTHLQSATFVCLYTTGGHWFEYRWPVLCYNPKRSWDWLIPHPRSPTTCLKNYCLSIDVGNPEAANYGTNTTTTTTTTSVLCYTGTFSSRA
jgi:hypothetical protein